MHRHEMKALFLTMDGDNLYICTSCGKLLKKPVDALDIVENWVRFGKGTGALMVLLIAVLFALVISGR